MHSTRQDFARCASGNFSKPTIHADPMSCSGNWIRSRGMARQSATAIRPPESALRQPIVLKGYFRLIALSSPK